METMSEWSKALTKMNLNTIMIKCTFTGKKGKNYKIEK